jgi:hypothetical protein
MTIAQFEALVDRISFHGIRFRVKDDMFGRGFVTFEMIHDTIDSDTLEPTKIYNGTTLNEWEIRSFDEERAIRWIRAMLVDRFIHEVDEFLRVDGLQLFHPHRKNGR